MSFISSQIQELGNIRNFDRQNWAIMVEYRGLRKFTFEESMVGLYI